MIDKKKKKKKKKPTARVGSLPFDEMLRGDTSRDKGINVL
jgi:hypothetical protein